MLHDVPKLNTPGNGAMPNALSIIHVIVSAKQWRHFDYLVPNGEAPMAVGMRVHVPFGRSQRTGVIIGFASGSSLPPAKLKPVISMIDRVPLISQDLMDLLIWAAGYYHFPLGEVVLNAFPPWLRQGHAAALPEITRWLAFRLPEVFPTRAPKQKRLLELLQQYPAGLTTAELDVLAPHWRPVMRTLQQKDWVRSLTETCSWLAAPTPCDLSEPLQLNEAQHHAVQRIRAAQDRFACFLLDGVTGSGKTEVYLSAMQHVLDQGRQCLVLVPEIGLTPQTLRRFGRRFAVPIAVLHSGLNDTDRMQNWMAAACGEARIVIGTRSAVFAPFADLGLIVVDEEHDASFKQQEGFRYHARDVAVMRAKALGIAVVMGSATPSLESFYNMQRQRYHALRLPQRAGEAQPPLVRIQDVRGEKMHEGVGTALMHKMRHYLDGDAQVLLFINRRGYAPVLLCHQCGWIAACAQCDANMVYYAGPQRVRCHHCGAQRQAEEKCPKCQAGDLLPVGYGTQRVEKCMREHFPDVDVVRIDRDSTRRKGAMDRMWETVRDGHRQILIGTQMMAKGHHFPNIQLVAILDGDQGLFSQDFRASERMAQLVVQVAGRAGRGERPGEVILQSHRPGHPLLQTLVQSGYHAFAEAALEERERADWPPFSFLALLRAEGKDVKALFEFLHEAKRWALSTPAVPARVRVLGPVPAPMEKRAGFWRGQLLLQGEERQHLQALLEQWVEKIISLPSSRRLRWSLDVDPVDLY